MTTAGPGSTIPFLPKEGTVLRTPDLDSIFTPEFLARLNDDVRDSLTSDAHNEAATAGPWAVRWSPEDGKWLVVAQDRPGHPAAFADEQAVALLVAAAYPALGRRFVRLRRNRDGSAHLETLDGEPLGTFPVHPGDGMEEFLQALEHLRRSPVALAQLLYAARGPALEQAAQILWRWLQAPPEAPLPGDLTSSPSPAPAGAP